MNKELFFFIGMIWWNIYLMENQYHVLTELNKIYLNIINFINYYNSLIFPEYFIYNDNLSDTENESDDNANNADSTAEEKNIVKYEHKYLDEIRKLNKEFEFTPEELELESSKIIEFYNIIKNSYFNEVEKVKDELGNIEVELTELEKDDYNYCNSDDERNVNNKIKELHEKENDLLEKIKLIKLKHETVEGTEQDIKQAQQLAKQFVTKKHLDRIKDCYIIEYTPLGNVLMTYDIEREAFKYYSDSTIPYRYLEPVGRKFVKQFNCRPIFVDMEEELKIAEEKWEKERKEKEEEEKRKKEDLLKSNTQTQNQEKKSVFAKFKSYNKEAGTGHINIAAPPKNSIPNRQLTEKQENEKILLKEKANRYAYEGKLANFSFNKKIHRKVIDKKYAMKFSDFKKIQQKNK